MRPAVPASPAPFRARFPTLTCAVIGLNVAVYAAMRAGGPIDVDSMVRFGGKVASLVADLGQLWRLVTGNFVHRDLGHLAMNMVVLFTVGGMLENAYRRPDYLALLFAAGLASMSASFLFSPAVTVGASGMVYGALAALIVYGIRHRALVPPQYRRVMGEAAVPTVLVFLWIGWTSVGVDTVAHLGGLLGGALFALLSPPRMNGEPGPRLAVRRVAVGAAVAACLAVPIFPAWAWSPSLGVQRDEGFGIAVPVPSRWVAGTNALGQGAACNGLAGRGRATFAADAIIGSEPVDGADAARDFAAQVLQPARLGSEVQAVRGVTVAPVRLGDRPAGRVVAELVQERDTTHLVAYLVPRGDWTYRLVFTWSGAYPGYAELLERLAQGVRFDEPKALREARARALLFPRAPWALARLGEALRRLGEPGLAAEALGDAVRDEPGAAAVRVEWARALLQAGRLEDGCREAQGALAYVPRAAPALEVMARCELSRGQPRLALALLEQAAQADPDDERVRRAQASLRQALSHTDL